MFVLCRENKLLEVELEKGEVFKAIAVVDRFTTGGCVTKAVTDRGYKCICVYSEHLENLGKVGGMIPEGLEVHFDATIAMENSVEEMVERLKT
jgi:hypothetical protein